MSHASEPVSVKLVQLPHAQGLPLPAMATPGSAGFDIVAALPEGAPMVLGFGERALVPTGLLIQLPDGHEAQLRPRSGLALRHGLTLLNTPGTIDSDYRGEISVLMICLGQEPVTLRRGERIAQLVVAPVSRAVFSVVDTLDDSERQAGGFGSTGR
jgi:dUTP pyrophosphatase